MHAFPGSLRLNAVFSVANQECLKTRKTSLEVFG